MGTTLENITLVVRDTLVVDVDVVNIVDVDGVDDVVDMFLLVLLLIA